MSEVATERTANTVTVDIDKDLYAKYEHIAKKYKIPVSRLINQELRRVEARRQTQEKLRRLRKSPFDLRNRKSVSLGKILNPCGPLARDFCRISSTAKRRIICNEHRCR